MNKLRIFVADDHAVVREGIKSLVNAQDDMTVVGEAADGLSVVEAVRDAAPDVVLLDISMPGLNGVQVALRLKQEFPNVKILTLTVHEDRSYLRQLLAAGGSGYLLKRALSEELIRAVRTVASGGTYIDPILASKLVGNLSRGRSLHSTLERTQLSEREEEVLRLISQGHTNKEIAARLSLSAKTVETYKTRSLEKLGFQSRADIVRYAVRQGWLAEV